MVFYPPVYDDEIIYSIFTRYFELSGLIGVKEALITLFGTSTPCIYTMFPKYLKRFMGKAELFNNQDFNKYMMDNTILPLFKPFICKDSFESIQVLLEEYEEKAINAKLGLTMKDSFIKVDSIKICLECIKMDYQKFGETYLRIEHQIKGNNVCWKHNEVLYEHKIRDYKNDTIIKINEIIRKNLIEDYFRQVFIGDTFYEHLDLAISIADIFKTKDIEINLQLTKDKYKDVLFDKKLITPKGYLKQTKLTEMMYDCYSSEFLVIQNAYIDEKNKDNWLHRMMIKSRNVTNPIKHLLFIRMLFGSYNDFLEY
ncbi:TnsD family Tn7-like transposition protein [Clostridium formicaceticum]|uniref:Transposon Tn7 transposition protein TnsD C-termianl domain-containing protein n=1 Tax=Clostridium formicaceticum TaxID=1497 RepID=A0AAC9RQX1_9CLOT|nr:TnsD family Tn7-like transposition protein [Clostridium formicaceticum]AOY75003.1 hypothetical protein BJL90_02920 [Clostridium formicaceticum]ARE89418.1 hypothetical protein CLFO_38250 [Clostridium formicaceticum]